MSELWARDFKDILALGASVLECETQQNLQAEILRQIERLVGARSSVYFDYIGSFHDGHFVSQHSRGVPNEAPKTWCKQYQKVDPFVSCLLRRLESGRGRVVVSSNVVKHGEYVYSDFYNDFLRPQSVYHIMVVGLVKDTEPIGLVGLHRPLNERTFSDQDALKAEFMAPHLSAAVQKVRLTDKIVERQWIIETLADNVPYKGVIFLDHDLSLIFANEHARFLLEMPKDDPNRIDPATFFLPDNVRRCCRQCKEILSSRHWREQQLCMDFTVKRGNDRVTGFVRAYEGGTKGLSFMVCLGTGSGDVINADSFTKFGLTRREIDIVHLVSAGITNPEIADKLFISVRTVQNHLRSIFNKVNVLNRTSLVSRLLRH